MPPDEMPAPSGPMPRHHAAGMTTIIRAEAAHDFLALVPVLAGYEPDRSLVCVAFRGNRTAGLLRHDLPARAADRERLVDSIVGTLCRMPGVDAIVPIAYSRAGYAGRRGTGDRRLLHLLVDRAEAVGFLVRDALHVARDGWGSILDPEVPEAGHPLALIEGSAVRRAHADLAPTTGRVDDGAVLPTAIPRVAREVADLLAAVGTAGGRDAFGRPRVDERMERFLDDLGDEVDAVVLVERLLDAATALRPEAIAPERLAWLLHLADLPLYRDPMMLQVAFGPVIGESALDDALRTADLAAEAGESVDEFMERERSGPGGPLGGEVFARLLLGHSSVRPDPARVDRGLDVLRAAIAHAPRGVGVGAACMAGWLAWTIGRGTVAAAFLRRAREADPDHTMTALLTAYLDAGALPEWAFHDELEPGDEVTARW